jgi:hypothetical protein
MILLEQADPGGIHRLAHGVEPGFGLRRLGSYPVLHGVERTQVGLNCFHRACDLAAYFLDTLHDFRRRFRLVRGIECRFPGVVHLAQLPKQAIEFLHALGQVFLCRGQRGGKRLPGSKRCLQAAERWLGRQQFLVVRISGCDLTCQVRQLFVDGLQRLVSGQLVLVLLQLVRVHLRLADDIAQGDGGGRSGRGRVG